MGCSKSRKVNHEAKVLAPKSRVQGVKRERVLSITRGLVGDSQVVFQNTNARWSFFGNRLQDATLWTDNDRTRFFCGVARLKRGLGRGLARPIFLRLTKVGL